jgi:multidrug efflux system outer membrane protein
MTLQSSAPPASPRTRRLTQIAALALAAALVGCISMAPHYARPPLPVQSSWGPEAAIAPTTPAAQLDWRDYFADERLRALIAQALVTNRDLRIAVARVEEARANYGIQRADQFPNFAVGADFARSRTPADLSLTGRPLTISQYQVVLALSTWEIDFWGRVRNLKEAALESYLSSDAARRAVTLSLISQVAQTYLSLRDLDERIAIATETIDSRAESLRISRRRLEVGAISKLNMTEVTVLWQQALALETQLEQQRAAQLHALQLLVGAPVDFPASQSRGRDADLMRELQPGLPSALLENRPDIISAEHALLSANANIGAARAAFFPQITLIGSAGTASTDLSGLFRTGSGAWTFAPSITLPIFQGGRLVSNLDLAKARHVEAVAQYEQTIQSAFRDVADALSARRWLASQVEILEATQATQTERARLAKLRYDSGAATFLEVLDAQRDLLDIEQEVVATRYALLTSQVNLYTALGGGSQPLAAAPVAVTSDAAPAAAPPAQ